MKRSIIAVLLPGTLAWAGVYATFEARAVREASLGMNASGIAGTVTVQAADRVKKGEVLLQLDDTQERLSLQMAQADLEALERESAFLSDQYGRYEQSARVFDKNTLDKLKTELEAKKATTQRARLAVAYARDKLARMTLRAPFAGTIAEKNVETGDMVTAMGGRPLFRLQGEQTKLVLQFDARYAGQVHVGDRFCYAVDGRTSSHCPAITRIYPAVNSQTRQMAAETDGAGMRPGIFGDGTIVGK